MGHRSRLTLAAAPIAPPGLIPTSQVLIPAFKCNPGSEWLVALVLAREFTCTSGLKFVRSRQSGGTCLPCSYAKWQAKSTARNARELLHGNVYDGASFIASQERSVHRKNFYI